MKKKTSRNWSQEELDLAHALKAQGKTHREIGAVIGRSRSSVECKMCLTYTGDKPAPIWTEEDDKELLRLIAKGLSLSMIAKQKGKTTYSIKSRLRYLPKDQVKAARAAVEDETAEPEFFVHEWKSTYQPIRTTAPRSVFELGAV